MEFRVLGPLEVSTAGQPLSLGGPKQRAVLALLLLNANAVVPRDRLIAEIWGHEPPPQVEASLRVYVARLRKLLATENGSRSIVETKPNGYVLRIEPEALDLNRFRALVASAETELAAGRPADAAAQLAEALGLWRGPALVDLAEDEWARREGAVLEELRLRALEERVEADLAVGRHADVVAELEALVAEHPYRERLTHQLMLALYRTGRQPEALEAYASASRRLRDEFGLEPTRELRALERAILEQADELEPAPVATTAPPLPSRRRRRLLAAVVVALALVLGVFLASSSRNRAASTSAEPLEGNSVVVVDPRTGSTAGEIPVDGRPSGLAVGFESVWVGNRDNATLLRIDPRTRSIETIGLGVEPRGVAVGGGYVWVVSEATNVVVKVDPTLNDVVARIELRTPPLARAQIAYARGAVWVTTWFTTLMRVDAATHAISTRSRDVVSIASAGNALWGLGWVDASRIRPLEPPGQPIPLQRVGATGGFRGLAGDSRSLWTASEDGTLWHVDAATDRVSGSVRLGRKVAGLALGERDVWVVTVDGHVLRVDPTTHRVVKSIPLGVFPPFQYGTIAVGEGRVWVAALER